MSHREGVITRKDFEIRGETNRFEEGKQFKILCFHFHLALLFIYLFANKNTEKMNLKISIKVLVSKANKASSAWRIPSIACNMLGIFIFILF